MKTLIAIALLALTAGCGKTVTTAELPDPVVPSGPQSEPATDPEPCTEANTARWTFTQPDPVVKRVVDLLFVVDTSESMIPKRAQIAETIPAFLGQLVPGTDYRIAVMLAHGGASTRTGRLHAAQGSPLVLKSTTMSQSAIRTALRKSLADVPDDRDEANGEAMLYSLARSLQPDRVKEIRSQGFYRPEAALSVVFVTDENDLCFPPQLNGFGSFPDYVPSNLNAEMKAFAKYCRAPGQTPSNFPATVYKRLTEFKGDAPVTLAGIAHFDPARVPRGAILEDAIGHGIIQTLARNANSVKIDIMDESYAAGLAQLGNVVSTTLELHTRFELDGTQSLLAQTVRVDVDKRTVDALFDAESRSVEIAAADAGHARSVIEVSACFVPPARK